MTVPIIELKLMSALTDYDSKQSTKKGYNIYALPQYIERAEAVVADIKAGADPRAAIVAGFTGRLADACLRAIGLPITTTDEANGGSVCYQPVTFANR